MKKSKIIFISFFILLFPCINSWALNFSYFVDHDNTLVCSISIPPFKTRNILNSMSIGHRVQIDYEVKIYLDSPRVFSFLGDKLEDDQLVSYIATRDPISGTFKIALPEGSKIEINSESEFFERFFSIENIKINLNKSKNGEYYIESRVKMRTIKLVPPLNLFSDILPGIIVKTDWIKVGNFRID